MLGETDRAHMVLFTPPTKSGLALVPGIYRDILLCGGAQDRDGPWDYFFIVIDHTISVAIECVCAPCDCGVGSA